MAVDKTALFAKSHLFPLKIRVFKCMSVCVSVVRQKNPDGSLLRVHVDRLLASKQQG